MGLQVSWEVARIFVWALVFVSLSCLSHLRSSPTPAQPRAIAHEGLRHPPACEALLPHALASTSAVDADRSPAS